MTANTQNLLPLYILAVLQAHDRQDGLTQRDIIRFLREDYGLTAERHALARNLKALKHLGDTEPGFGFQLTCSKEAQRASQGTPSSVATGWRLVSQSDFDPSETRLLIDSVLAFEVMPPRQRDDLVNRLNALAERQGNLPSVTKPLGGCLVNRELFHTIDVITEALREQKPLEFVLGCYRTDKKLHLSADDTKEPNRHVVLPVQLLVSRGRYYLVAHYPGHEKYYHFRVDLMLEAKLHASSLSAANHDPSNANFNITSYRAMHPFMMGDAPVPIRFRVRSTSLTCVFDQFGDKVDFKRPAGDFVEACVVASAAATESWALQFAGTVEILEPTALVKSIRKRVKQLTETYGLQNDSIPS